jgi:hypothetical protein
MSIREIRKPINCRNWRAETWLTEVSWSNWIWSFRNFSFGGRTKPRSVR